MEREARLRDVFDTLIARLDLDLPPEAIQPHHRSLRRALAEWDAEFLSAAPNPSGAEPNGA